jgi:hypothetical protein
MSDKQIRCGAKSGVAAALVLLVAGIFLPGLIFYGDPSPPVAVVVSALVATFAAFASG